jgi:cystathionine beta-lyase/cystathionine gamma-synthase
MLIDPADVAICVADDEVRDPQASAPTSTPIVQTSLFTFPNFQMLVDALSAETRHHVYTRGRNPTVEAVERKLAALERGEAGKCFASGMAAISAVMLGLLKSGRRSHSLREQHLRPDAPIGQAPSAFRR